MQKLDKPDCYCIDRDPSTWQPRLHWKASRSLYKQLRSRRILPLLGACNHPDSPSNSSPFSSHALWWNHQSESLTNLDFLPPSPKKKSNKIFPQKLWLIFNLLSSFVCLLNCFRTVRVYRNGLCRSLLKFSTFLSLSVCYNAPNYSDMF